MRLPSSKAAAQQRSINLAISARGLAAIQTIDPAAADRFLSTVIPMRGRMIHDAQGRLQSQPYDRDGQVSIRAASKGSWMNLFSAPSVCRRPSGISRTEIVHQFDRPRVFERGSLEGSDGHLGHPRIFPSQGHSYRF